MSALSMTVAEREAFLADLHVGVVGIERADGPPLVVPVWYSYEPGGEVVVLIDRTSLKGRLLERAGRCSLCAQDERPPYRYVSVEGPVTITPSDRERDSRPMARRYLGPSGGDRYVDGGPPSADSVRVALRPERWFTVDYGKLGAAGSTSSSEGTGEGGAA
jgi:PPOX class probable F420-dependent enzyme